MNPKPLDMRQTSAIIESNRTPSHFKKIEYERLIFREAMRDFKRTNYLTHSFFPYPGRFIPQIPRYFIRTYARNDGIILEPFSGSGCTLVEAKLSGYDSCGIEINPFGRLLAKVKTTSIEKEKLDQSRVKLFDEIRKFHGQPLIPEFTNIDYWFDEDVQNELGMIRQCIDDMSDERIRQFYLVCFAGIIRKCSNSDPQQIKPAKTKKMRTDMPKPEPTKLFQEKVLDHTDKMIAFNSYMHHISRESTKVSIIGDDSRNIKLPKDSVSLIVTSPPFLSAHDYFRTTKFEIFWTGLSDVKTLINLDSQLIGGERVSRRDSNNLHLLNTSGLEQIDDIIEFIFKIDPSKAYIIYKYFTEMKKTFQELKRVLEPSGKFCITIGDNVVRKVPIKTHELIINVANSIGFGTERVGYDVIKSHALMTKRHNDAAVMDKEWAMVFCKN